MRRQVGEVKFGATRIGYLIERSKNRSTIAITVHPDGTVSVVAPKGTRCKRISGAVVEKSKWILEQQEFFRQHQNGYPRQFVSGESLYYLGRQYKLKVQRSRSKDANPEVRMSRGLLLVTIPKDVDTHNRAEAVRKRLVAWYRERAKEHIPKITARYADSLGLNYVGVQIRDMKKRWGSATNRRLSFNWRIIMASRRLVEYVVAHELCHLVHQDHSKEFWRLLERAMPDCERRRLELAIQGPKFDLRTECESKAD